MKQSLFTAEEPVSQTDPLAGASASPLLTYALALGGAALVFAVLALAVALLR